MICDNKCYIWKKYKCNLIIDSKLGDYLFEIDVCFIVWGEVCMLKYLCYKLFGFLFVFF